MSWGGVAHPACNAVAVLVWLLAVIAVLRVPTERFGKGWATKAFWVLVAGAAAVYISGFYLPVGALIGFGTARYYRRVPAGPRAAA